MEEGYMKFKIVQLKDIAGCPYAFRSYDYAKSHGFNFDDYKVVYEGDTDDFKLPYGSKEPNNILESLFAIFNNNHPEGYKGHSLSVSDLVELDGLAYYCDSFSWTAL